MTPIEQFYFDKPEPVKSCLLALKAIIIDYHSKLEPRWYYRLPCFMYQGQLFCYLWVDKRTQWPYIAVGKGVKIEDPDLIQGKRTFTKLVMINPNEDLSLEAIYRIFDKAMLLYPKP